MLDAYIIEELRKREEARRQQERPSLELPLPEPRPTEARREIPREPRRVIIIDP